MKIAYDYQIFTTQRYGGISRYFVELVYQLARYASNSLDCRIFSPIYINEYLYRSSKELSISGVFIPSIPRLNRIYSCINCLVSPRKITNWSPSIVHKTYYSSSSVASYNCPTVLTVYDMICELHPELYSASERKKDVKKLAVERADHVICISYNTRNDLIRLFDVPPQKISVVHLGFSLMKSDSLFQPSHNRPYILYVGSRWGYKNFTNLLAAYASRPELRNTYDLVAFGGGSFNTHEVEMIQSLHLTREQVRQHSGDDGILAGMYKHAAMFVYPSLYEGFGIPPLEAMSFTCPVAASNTSSIPEVVGDAAIQFNPFDIESIADALVMLSSDFTLQRRLIDLGRKRIDSFSWERCAMQTLAVYRDLLK